MRLLFFVHSLDSGGSERVTATLAGYWSGNEWDVTVVTVSGRKRDFYVLDSTVHRYALRLSTKSRNPGHAIINNIRRVWALRRVLLQERPDVAVGMMTTANATLAVAGRLAGVPTVGSERIHPPRSPLGRFWEFARRRTYPLLSGLVAQTEDSAIWLRQHAPARCIAVIPNPVNYPVVAQSPRIPMPEVLERLQRAHILLAVGRLEEQKGFDRLLAGFGALAERQPDWALVILGEGRMRGALTQQAIDLGIADRVALPGVAGNVGEWFESADLYVLTSRFEGFPNALLEALAYGVPSVAVDCETGPSEILRHEVDGLLVPEDDPDALISALERMMSDAELRRRCAARAVEARERFAVERIAGQWESLFEQCISESRIG